MTNTVRKPNRAGAPAGYRELQGFFPTPSSRARALGVKRDTIQVWDQRRAVRLRATSQGRVTLLLALCSVISPRMLNPRDVGRWLLTPQPSLHGRSPIDLLRELGDDAYEQLRDLSQRDDPRPEPLTPADWDALEGELDPAVVGRIRGAYEEVVRGAIPADLDVYELV